jgi:hypothetical protein
MLAAVRRDERDQARDFLPRIAIRSYQEVSL